MVGRGERRAEADKEEGKKEKRKGRYTKIEERMEDKQ